MIKIIFALVLMIPTTAFAVCGDVTGDDKVTSSDALAVLNKAVGLDANLKCKNKGADSRIAFANVTACSSGTNYTTEWSGMSRAWNTQPVAFPPTTGDWRVTSADSLTGRVEATIGNCGTYFWDFDERGLEYLLPPGGYVLFYTGAVDDQIWLLADLWGTPTMTIGDVETIAIGAGTRID